MKDSYVPSSGKKSVLSFFMTPRLENWSNKSILDSAPKWSNAYPRNRSVWSKRPITKFRSAALDILIAVWRSWETWLSVKTFYMPAPESPRIHIWRPNSSSVGRKRFRMILQGDNTKISWVNRHSWKTNGERKILDFFLPIMEVIKIVLKTRACSLYYLKMSCCIDISTEVGPDIFWVLLI